MVGIIGCGRWGRNHVRTCQELSIPIKTCDHHGGKDYRNYLDLLADDSVDAVIVATPAETHHQIAKDALLAGKHVFVEKPFALHEAEARALIAAIPDDRILMVGYITCYDPCVEKLKELLPTVGAVHRVQLERMGRYPDHKHTDIITDLTCHDVATLVFLELTGDIYNAYDVPQKRLLSIEGEKGTLSTDYTKIYLNGEEIYQPPQEIQPLRRELETFLAAITTGAKPRTDVQFGLEVVKQCDHIRQFSDCDRRRYMSYHANGWLAPEVDD